MTAASLPPAPLSAPDSADAPPMRAASGHGDFWTRRLPLQGDGVTRFLLRAVSTLSMPWMRGVEGLENIAPERDPFILALNHSQRPEAVLVPTRLILERRGRLVHFMADWNFLLVPFVSLCYRKNQVVLVMRKKIKPRFLNRLKPFFSPPGTSMERARALLDEGRSLGVFPEGTINRHPRELLRGQHGAARLAIGAGVPVVPGGIVFNETGEKISDYGSFRVRLGEAIPAPSGADEGDRTAVREHHARIMTAISRLSGKEWSEEARRKRYEHS